MALNIIETIGAVLVANGIFGLIVGTVLYTTKTNKIDFINNFIYTFI
jgi:hypothetical protein